MENNVNVTDLIKSKAKGRPSKRPDSVWLLTLYQSSTAEQLAKEFKVSRSTIFAWVKEAKEELTNQKQ